MADEIHIVIADDHPVVRQGLRAVIEKDAGLKLVAEASDGRSAIEQIRATKPAVAILDIGMPGMDGLAAAELLHREMPELKIIFLTMHQEAQIFEKALAIGATGYVLKDTALVEITQCIREVARGGYFASPALTGYLMHQKTARRETTQAAPGIGDLTAAERQILLLLAEYKTTGEIAEALFISPRTVDTHRANICGKLELRGPHALMKFAVAHMTELG